MAATPDPVIPSSIPATLDAWLQHIAAVHPREIELGLERIREVAARMGITRPAARVITVAGTNGKGSTLALLNQFLVQTGQRVGLYTSPHMHRFNERILVNNAEASDTMLCDALAMVEQSRADTSLSYFEFATLAALWIFQQSELDFALLEVGLGGRLDAVNIIDADIAVITSIELDHMDWLGNSREQIALEKAGILRPGQTVILAEPEPPQCLTERLQQLQCQCFRLGEEYRFTEQADGESWDWQGSFGAGERGLNGLPLPGLPLASAATALQLLEILRITLCRETIEGILRDIVVPGRWELRREQSSGRLLLLDVAHNPAAAALLHRHLLQMKQAGNYNGKVAVVLAAMADKDVEGIVLSLESISHIWYIAQLDEPRCMPLSELAGRIEAIPGERLLSVHDTVGSAVAAAIDATTEQDLVVVTGSFMTVSQARALSTAI